MPFSSTNHLAFSNMITTTSVSHQPSSERTQ